jgi:RNA polymerase sigma-70 factor (sigma-E family)
MEDEADLEAFVAARGPALLRLAVLLTADAETAQDLVQEALVRVLPRWPQVAAGGSPEAYLRTTIRRAWIDSWRRRRRLEFVADPPDDVLAATDEEGHAVRLSVEAALARLTVRQRTVLVLRFYEDLTEVETARLMGCSQNTVKTQTRRALERLRVLAPDLVLLRASDPPAGEPAFAPEVTR